MIFMDIHMPEMDGYEATHCIRGFEKEKGLQAVPIIAMTANVFREDVEKCIAAGMNEHIGKPIDLGELFKKMDTFLLNRQP
jgi:CheY-like chemotaxis protein